MELVLDITFDPKAGLSDALVKVKGIDQRAQACQPILMRVQEKVAQYHIDHFNQMIHPGNKKWVLKDSTIKKKRKKGSRFPERPLIDTGEMQSLINDHKPKPSNQRMECGTTSPIAKIHHYGVPKGAMPGKPNYELPKRQFIGLTAEEITNIWRMIHAYVSRGNLY